MNKAILKKIRNIILWMSLYFFVFAFAAFFTTFFLIKGETIETPNLKGKTINQAKKILEKNNLYLKKKRDMFSIQYEKGKIIRQYPEPEDKIKKNHFVMVYVSKGGERIKIPNLIGKNLKIAQEEILQDILSITNTASIHYKLDPNTIIAQSPKPGQNIHKEKGIHVLISKGQRPVTYIMPDFIGENIKDVFPSLQEFGFRIEGRGVEYEGISRGTIVRQTPLTGYKIKKGNIITFDVVK